jgi:ABC-type Fe3+ transport system substrate-binding protein
MDSQHSHISRRSILLGAASLAGLAAAGVRPSLAQADVDALYEAAKKEGQILFYASNHPDLTGRLVDAFSQDFPGIKVEVVRLATGALGKRYAAEAEAGNVTADLLQLGDPLLIRDAADKGWIAPIDDVPNYAGWPDQFKGPRHALIAISPQVLTYNTDLVPEADVPKAWTDLLDPKFKGQIISTDIRVGAGQLDWYLLMEKTYGTDFLKDFAAQDIRWVPSNLPGMQLLAAGEGAFLAPGLKQVTFSLIEQGAPIANVDLEPTVVHESLIAVSTDAPHPNAARLLLSYFLTPKAQQIYNQGVNASPLAGLENVDPIPSSYIRPDPVESQKQLEHLLDVLGIS